LQRGFSTKYWSLKKKKKVQQKKKISHNMKKESQWKSHHPTSTCREGSRERGVIERKMTHAIGTEGFPPRGETSILRRISLKERRLKKRRREYVKRNAQTYLRGEAKKLSGKKPAVG